MLDLTMCRIDNAQLINLEEQTEQIQNALNSKTVSVRTNNEGRLIISVDGIDTVTTSPVVDYSIGRAFEYEFLTVLTKSGSCYNFSAKVK